MAFNMRLDSLELTNFHQFAHYFIDFDEQLTVLVGNNGTGKSSILAAASVALGTFLSHFNYSWQRPLSRHDARVVSFQMGEAHDRQEQYPVVVTARGAIGEQEKVLEWSRSLNSADGDDTTEHAKDLLSLSRESAKRVQNGDKDLVLPILACYGTGRLWSKSGSGNDRRRTFSRQDGYRNCLDAHADEEQMLSWFFKMTAQDIQRAQSLRPLAESSLFTAVRRAIEKCFTAITGSSRTQVTYNFDADDLDIEYFDEHGEIQQMALHLLSDGYRTALSMFADIAYRMAILNPTLGEHVLETPGAVLIDEIDLHLHPLWQARILGDLREVFPNVQFIVSTHAPVVISSVRACHIRLLQGSEKAQRLSGEIYGSDVGRTLVSVMGTPERPKKVQNQFDEFYRALDEENFNDAKKTLAELEAMIGSDDTDLVAAQTALSLEKAWAEHAAN